MVADFEPRGLEELFVKAFDPKIFRSITYGQHVFSIHTESLIRDKVVLTAGKKGKGSRRIKDEDWKPC